MPLLHKVSMLLWAACLPLWVSAQAPANAPASTASAVATPARKLALLLPPSSGPLARAVEAVRAGVGTAQAAAGQPVEVQTIDVDEQPQSLARALRSAREAGAEVIIGPLLRPQVNAVLRSDPGVPLVTLSLPDSDGDASSDTLAFGLAIETEARWLAQAAVAQVTGLAATAPVAAGTPAGASMTGGAPRFAILVGEGPLARRAAAALQASLQEAGERATAINVASGYDALQQLADRLFKLDPKAIFLALDAREAAMVRPRLAHDAALFATSQVNAGGAEGALLMPELEGIRFVDAPWLVEPDHPAVMAYARPAQPLSAELQRLYALGIDAFRLALEWASGWRVFSIDGVTGGLQVDRARSLRVERTPAFAVFRDGKVQRWDAPAAERPGR
jgi:outer membrane PBP1 activator LpoA protein